MPQRLDEGDPPVPLVDSAVLYVPLLSLDWVRPEVSSALRGWKLRPSRSFQPRSYSPALNSAIAMPSISMPSPKMTKICSAIGTVQPNQVIGGFRVSCAAAETSRLSKTRVRIGDTA